MKLLKRVISLVVCMAMCCSMLVVQTHAKAPKKYVKSISVPKKGIITLYNGQTNIKESYKVTVKVKGKVSKKFTATSSKKSVATVKVKGKKIVVTAKKPGFAKIKVKTKAKGKNKKKLTKTLKMYVYHVEDDTRPAPIVPAKLIQEELNLGYSPYADSTTYRYAQAIVTDCLENIKKGSVYTAEVADTNLADFIVNKDGEPVIYAKAVGQTTAKIYEQIGDKKILLGTVNIIIDEDDMGELVAGMLSDVEYKGFDVLYIKENLGVKTIDLDKKIKDFILHNDTTKVTLKESDFTITYDVNDGYDSATISDDGIISGLKNGTGYVNATVNFVDGSETYIEPEIRVSGRAIEHVPGYTINNIRDYVIGLDTPVPLANGQFATMINFDNAATTPALKAVQEAIDEELEMYGSIGRGFSQKSNHSTDVYNNTRDKVLEFLTADPEFYTCFYVNSTTDGLNKLASALITSKEDVVLTTRIEHHANDLSWRERCNKVLYAEVDDKGRVIYDDIERLLKTNKVKIVSVSAASNVTGYVNDVHRVARLAHKYGAKIVVDGAQIVAHRKFSMMGDLDDKEDDIDFFAFSAHKMYSPYGGGAVVGLTEELNQHMPTFYGGGTIKVVGDYWQVYKDAPAVYEAGSPNYPGVVGLGKAIDVLSTVGLDNIEAHEKELNRKIIDGLSQLDQVILYGDSENIDDRVGVVSFNFEDINTFCLAQVLSEDYAVATRRGAFCAHPYVWRLMGISDDEAKGFENCTDANTAGMVRVSFGIYNNEEDVENFLSVMPAAMDKARQATKETGSEPAY